jgi:hypothetical protein
MTTRAPNEENAVDYGKEESAVGQMSMDSEKTIEVEEPDQIARRGIKPVDVPPDGGYGWVCTACVFLINAHTWGVNSASPSQLLNRWINAKN